MTKKILYSSVLLLLGTVFLTPSLTPAHGQFTGTVCIIPTSSSSCPSSPPTISGTVGTQLRVSVFIQGSDALNGFDITLLADHTILKPAGADLTGTVLPQPPSVVEECVGGVLVTGSTCQPTDTIDTLHVAAVGGLGQITTSPTTGLLFTAIYNVTAATGGTPIGYQTGCTAPTSVSNTCITITNGSPTPDPETAQTATFTTGPDFSVSASPSTLKIRAGKIGIETLAITSLNGFSGTVSGSGSISPVVTNGPSFPTSIAQSISSGQTVNFPLAINTSKHTPLGNYVLTYVLTSGSLSHTVTFTVTVSK